MNAYCVGQATANHIRDELGLTPIGEQSGNAANLVKIILEGKVQISIGFISLHENVITITLYPGLRWGRQATGYVELGPQIYKGDPRTCAILIPALGSNWGSSCFPVVCQVRMSPASAVI